MHMIRATGERIWVDLQYGKGTWVLVSCGGSCAIIALLEQVCRHRIRNQ